MWGHVRKFPSCFRSVIDADWKTWLWTRVHLIFVEWTHGLVRRGVVVVVGRLDEIHACETGYAHIEEELVDGWVTCVVQGLF